MGQCMNKDYSDDASSVVSERSEEFQTISAFRPDRLFEDAETEDSEPRPKSSRKPSHRKTSRQRRQEEEEEEMEEDGKSKFHDFFQCLF